MKPMDPVLQHKWIEALKSDNYKQAKGILYNSYTNGYCCLGVLLEVAGYDKHLYYGMGKVSYWLGEDHRLLPQALEDEVILMNDDGTSFKDIANYIEKVMSGSCTKE